MVAVVGAADTCAMPRGPGDCSLQLCRNNRWLVGFAKFLNCLHTLAAHTHTHTHTTPRQPWNDWTIEIRDGENRNQRGPFMTPKDVHQPQKKLR